MKQVTSSEDEDKIIIRNACLLSADYAPLYPRRSKSSPSIYAIPSGREIKFTSI
jgi:hypothetical protein